MSYVKDHINGKVIQKKINENLTYSELYNSEENFWSLLFETDYVTLAGPYNENGYTLLRLPNEEVKRLFISSSELVQKQYQKRESFGIIQRNLDRQFWKTCRTVFRLSFQDNKLS